MNEALQRRIATLDGKQVIHYITLIANGVESGGQSDDAFADLIGRQLGEIAGSAGVGTSADFSEAAQAALLEGKSVETAARDMLAAWARTPDGERIVGAALDQPATITGDFGVLSGFALLTFTWLAITGDLKVKIGGVEYHKEGLSSSGQVELGKAILPQAIKALTG